MENVDRSIRGPESLAHITQTYPLVSVIPLHSPNNAGPSPTDCQASNHPPAGIGIAAACNSLAHFFWLPLDVVWFAALRKFGPD